MNNKCLLAIFKRLLEKSNDELLNYNLTTRIKQIELELADLNCNAVVAGD